MPMGVLFWMIMVIWFVTYGWGTWGSGPSWAHGIVLFILLFLLGWHDFGFVVK
jgi:hypothetical protein